MVSVFPDGMNDYDVFTKTCMNPWAQVFTPENQSTEQARRPANHAKQATSVDFKGTPLCGCKNGSKTTILNKGLNEEQLA